MGSLKFGCQTYSWEMTFDKYSGKIPHILDVMSRAGFEGCEFEVVMLGDYFKTPKAFKEELEKYGLEFGALALPLNWLHKEETAEEYQQAQDAIAFLKDFPETQLVLCHYPQKDRENLRERQDNQIACLKAIAERADDKGILTSFHANSSSGSIFRTAEDYDRLIHELDGSKVWLAPDIGHIAHGNMDPYQFVVMNRPKIKHIHFKDMDENHTWQPMGEGEIDFPAIVSYLRETDYQGWIMVEEESKLAEDDPDGANLQNGVYIKEVLQ